VSTAIYYLKARFATPAAAKNALPNVQGFIREGIRAHAWWQNHRHYEHRGQRPDFWKLFQWQFPPIHKYLGSKAGGDCDQALLGFLEFGKDQEFELRTDREFLLYRAEVWHGADWDLIGEFLKTEFSAEASDWIGQEDPIDYFEILDP
jgi:hypothetical protein